MIDFILTVAEFDHARRDNDPFAGHPGQDIQGHGRAARVGIEGIVDKRIATDDLLLQALDQRAVQLAVNQLEAERQQIGGLGGNGQIVACLVDGDSATIKRFVQEGKSIFLKPENRDYTPIKLSTDDFESGSARILGVASEVKIVL
jgi:hypothetical protein